MDTRGQQIYVPLEPNSPAVRFIRVLEEHDDGTPQISLVPSQLYIYANHFRAISYTWSTGPPVHEIIVNDKRVLISRNVYMLLEQWQFTGLGRQHFAPMLWIDSICINQADTEERNTQVKLMGEIYSQATEVCIWLDETSAGFTVPKIAHKLKACDRSMRKVWETLAADYISETGHGIVREVWEIFEHPYWKRVWIIQEVVLAREVKLMLQGGMFDLQRWKAALGVEQRYFNSLSDGDREKFAELHSNMRFLNMLLHYREFPQRRSLAGLLKTCQAHRCKIAKDMVYGVLGLADDGDRIPVDYQKSDVEVMLDALDVVYPAEIVSEQLRAVAKLFEALRLRLADIWEYILNAVEEQQAKPFAKVCPVQLKSVVGKDTNDAAVPGLVAYQASDTALSHCWMFSQSKSGPKFVCFVEPASPSAIHSPEPDSVEAPVLTVYCSAWDLILLSYLSSGSTGISKEFEACINRCLPVVSQEEVDARFAASKEDSEDDQLHFKCSTTPDSVTLTKLTSNKNLCAMSGVEDPTIDVTMSSLLNLTIEDKDADETLSKAEQLRARVDYWRTVRKSRMIDDLHSGAARFHAPWQ